MATKRTSFGKKILIGVLILIVLVLGVLTFFFVLKKQTINSINSYEDCVAAGYPSLESFPPQCKTPDGRSFTQVLDEHSQYADEIKVENPTPNQKISSPITVSGEARGYWFFEASFPGELYDDNGNSLGTVILTAEGDWMTEDFVPFSGTLEFTTPQTPKGKLIIRNNNPSGEEGTQKEFSIPVTF